MTGLSQEQVRGFFENLKTAIYDKQLENSGYELLFFIDADVAVRMVAGFEDSRGGLGEQLVRALMACGFCGPLGILRPHAVELYDYVSWRGDQRERSGVGFHDRAMRFLEKEGLVLKLRDLSALARSDSGQRAADPAQYLEALRSAGVQAFVGLEAAMGPWQRRLRRLYGSIIQMHTPGPEIAPLLEEKAGIVSQITDELRALQGPSPYRSISSDYRDACALGALHWFKERAERGVDKRLVRFYTETSILRTALLERKGVSSNLVYQTDFTDVAGVDVAARRIVRTPEYFLMRSRFSQLTFDKGGAVSDLDEIISGVSSDEIRRLEGPGLEQALRGFSIDGENLAEVIAEFEDLTLIKNVWTADRIPDAVLSSLPEWRDVVDVLTGKRTADILETRIDTIQKDLGQHVDRIGSWMRDFELLLKETGGTVRSGLAGLTSLDYPALEARLGTRRWGIELDDGTLQRVARALERVGAGSVDNHRVCQEIATSMEHARENEEEAVFACTVLWALSAYSRLVEVLRDLEKRTGGLPVSLQLLSSAATLRGAVGMSRIDPRWVKRWSRRIDDLRHVITEHDECLRDTLKVGLAYVLFHLARAVEGLSRRDDAVRILRDRWLAAGVELAEEAKNGLDPGTLPWALAVNHCLYVGVICSSDMKSILENQALLHTCDKHPLWNQRFDDTIGRYYIWRFNERISGDDPEALREDLRRAKEYLKKAEERDIGDIALTEHRAELEKAEGELRPLLRR